MGDLQGMRPLRDLVRHTLIYGVGSVGVSLISFVLIPVYTRYLTAVEYGILALFLLAQAVLTRIYDLGLTNAVGRFFFDYRGGDAARGLGEMVTTTSIFLLVYGAVLSTALVFASPWVAEFLVGDSSLALYARVMAITLFFEALAIPALTLIRMEERSALWVTLSVVRVSTALVLNIYFVVHAGLGVLGVLISGAISAAVVFLLTLRPLLARAAPAFRWDVLRSMLAFGLPFLPVLLGVLVIDLSDRYLLQWFRSTEEVGVYSLGYKFGQIMMLAVSAFSMGWAPLRYRIYERDDAARLYSRILSLVASLVAVGTVGISVFGDEVVRLATTPAFFEGARVIPWICLSYALYGLYLVVTTGMGVTKRTGGLTVGVILAAAVNLGANLVLIPRFGMMGAAVATAGAYLVMVIVTERLSARVYPIAYEWGLIVRIGALAGVAIVLDRYLQPEGIASGMALATALLVSFVLALGMVGAVTRGDVEAARGWVAELARPRRTS